MTTSTSEWTGAARTSAWILLRAERGRHCCFAGAQLRSPQHHEMGPLAEHLAPRYSDRVRGLAGIWRSRAAASRLGRPIPIPPSWAFLLTSVVPHPHAVTQPCMPRAMPSNMRQAHRKPRRGGPYRAHVAWAVADRAGRTPAVSTAPPPVSIYPGFGPLVYRLNVNAFVVRRMGAGHVYTDSGVPDRRAADVRSSPSCARRGHDLPRRASSRRSRSARRARRISRSRAARANS
jgi:hypothetical protein